MAASGERKERANGSFFDQPMDRIFVGREREMAELRAAFQDAHDGRGHLYLLAGEPGIGKTRTTEEFAAYAQQHATRFFLGRCYEGEGAPPFWPWVQVVRSYFSTCDPHTVRVEMGAGAMDIAQIIPEVREYVPDLASPPVMTPEAARFRFFDSFTQWLKSLAKTQPLLVILDDLHWADTPSLLLLQFVARDVQDARILVVATYRDVELGIRHPLTLALGELVRIPGTRSLPLRGLTIQETTQLLELTMKMPPLAALVQAVQQETEGNPFFVNEMVRAFMVHGQPATVASSTFAPALPLPQRVRGMLAKRLQGLSEECQQLLSVASVIGKEFRLEVLRQLAALPQFAVSHAVPEVLDEAVQARVLVSVPQTIGRYSFAHALLRETLYEEIPLSRRAKLHRLVGEVLEVLNRIDLELPSSPRNGQVVAELAYHFFVAMPDGEAATKALLYAQRAGVRATATFAYGEAAVYYAHALEALEFQPGSGEQRGELLLALGEAQSRAGNTARGRETFVLAAELAQALGRPALLARAALGFAGALVTPGRVDKDTVRWLEESLTVLGEDAGPLRAQVLARLAMELYYSDARERRFQLSEQAVALARRSDEKSTLAMVLNARHYVLWDSDHLTERLRIATEMVTLAEEERNRELALLGVHWRVVDLLEQGDIVNADRAIATHARLAEELRQPYHLFYSTAFRAMRALLAGHFVEGEQLLRQTRAYGQRAQMEAESELAYGIQMFTLWSLRGRRAELEKAWEHFERLIQQIPDLLSLQIVHTDLAAALGRKDEAQQIYLPLAEKNFVDLTPNLSLLASAMSLARVCVFLGDVARAPVLYRLMQPYAECCITIGPAIGCLGSVSLYLGLLATLLRRWEEARTHFEAAVQQNVRLGARPLVAHAQYEYARMLLTRGRAGDVEQARGLLEEALATVQELGMEGLEEKIKTSQSELPPSLTPAPATSDQAASSLPAPSLQPSISLFRYDDDRWTISYQGATFHLRSVRGLRYIAHLLRNPQAEFHVLDLVSVGLGEGAEQMSKNPSSQSETAAPSHLRAAYRQRLEDLHEELEEAREFHDTERAARVQEELDRAAQQIATKMGLGRQDRNAALRAERARVNVVKGIASALSKIAAHSPALELYLSKTLKTGLYCSYTPDPRLPVHWQF
jgi:tetratricopeptide (TPR) repeat protein